MSRLDIPSANDQTLNYVHRLNTNLGSEWSLNGRWKGNKWWNRTYGSAVPTSSQPQTNLSVNTGTDCSLNGWSTPCYDRSFRGLPSSRASGIYHGNRGNRGPLNPIKHWRKQLQPSQGHVTGKVSLNNVIWTPGGSAKATSSTLCCDFETSITFEGQPSLFGAGGDRRWRNFVGELYWLYQSVHHVPTGARLTHCYLAAGNICSRIFISSVDDRHSSSTEYPSNILYCGYAIYLLDGTRCRQRVGM